MIKGSIQEEDITIVNIYAPYIEAPQYIKQMLHNSVTQQWGTLTPHLHQWIDHPDRKAIRKHRP